MPPRDTPSHRGPDNTKDDAAVEQNSRPAVQADAYFAIIPEWVLDAAISPTAVRCFAVLQRYANNDNQCWPGRTLLAKRMRCSPDTVDRAIKELITIKAVTVTARYQPNGHQTSNLYVIHMGAAQMRRGVGIDAEGVAAQMPTKSKKKNQSQEQIHSSSSNDDGFEQFWGTYPRKVGKQAAVKAYKNALKHTQPETILTALHLYKLATRDKDPQYIAHPATWLNQHRWLDEHPTQTEPTTPQAALPPTYCGNCYHGWIETTNERGNQVMNPCPCTKGKL